MRVVFLVIASDDPIHQTDLEIQKQTWVKTIPDNFRVIWLRGSEVSITTLDGDTLFVPCKELYENILEKTILGIRFLLENLDFDILIRTNVSTYFDSKRLIKELNKTYFSGSFVGGYFDKTNGKFFNHESTFEYISGTGMFMSRNAALTLSEMNIEVFRHSPDDVAISHYLMSREVSLIRMSRGNLSSTHFFIPSSFIRAKSSTDSSLAGRRMVFLHEYFTSDNFRSRLSTIFKIIRLEISAFLTHPEPKIRYIQRNRVVIVSFIKTKGWQLWQIISPS